MPFSPPRLEDERTPRKPSRHRTFAIGADVISSTPFPAGRQRTRCRCGPARRAGAGRGQSSSFWKQPGAAGVSRRRYSPRRSVRGDGASAAASIGAPARLACGRIGRPVGAAVERHQPAGSPDVLASAAGRRPAIRRRRAQSLRAAGTHPQDAEGRLTEYRAYQGSGAGRRPPKEPAGARAVRAAGLVADRICSRRRWLGASPQRASRRGRHRTITRGAGRRCRAAHRWPAARPGGPRQRRLGRSSAAAAPARSGPAGAEAASARAPSPGGPGRPAAGAGCGPGRAAPGEWAPGSKRRTVRNGRRRVVLEAPMPGTSRRRRTGTARSGFCQRAMLIVR